MQTVIIFSSVRWNYLFQRHHIVALSLSHVYKVIFVEPPVRSIHQMLKAIFKFWSVGLIKGGSRNPKNPNIRIRRRAFLNVFGLSDGRFLKQLEKSEKVKAVIFYIPSDRMVKIVEKNSNRFFVYDRVLDWKNVDKSWYPPINSERNEQIIHRLRNCKVITDSYTYSVVSNKNFISRTEFVPTPLLKEFRALSGNPNGPLGYYGNLREYEIDIQLIEVLAKHHAIHVVGLFSEKVKQRLQPYGVKFTESVPPQVLPSIIKTWSKIILPYKNLERSSTFVPDKLWSASATKLPIVASGIDIPRDYTKRISFASGREEFVSLCARDYFEVEPICFEQGEFVDLLFPSLGETNCENE